uniref:Uncharacterized protein n=1 Tax=Anguilla anguilla TaxID=7936 RepID=A0A0E9XHZ2_ANGAN
MFDLFYFKCHEYTLRLKSLFRCSYNLHFCMEMTAQDTTSLAQSNRLILISTDFQYISH